MAVGSVVLLVAVALVKVGLVLYYYMHIYKLNQECGDDQHALEYKTATSRLGLWLFLLSDSFVFGGLAVARFNLLGFTRPHLNQVLGLAVTCVLLLSSFFMNRAETSMAHGDRKGFQVAILITLVLGPGVCRRRSGRGMADGDRRGRFAFGQRRGRHLLHDDRHARAACGDRADLPRDRVA